MIETFNSLLHDRAHWEFELLVGFIEMLVLDGLIIGLCWPFVRKHWQHHVDRDEIEEIEKTLVDWRDIPANLDWSLNHPDHVTVCGFTKAPYRYLCIRNLGHDGPCANEMDQKNRENH